MKCCKLQNGKGCPGERLKPCAPQYMDKVHAPQWLKAGQNPPISTSEAGQHMDAETRLLSPVAHTLSVAEEVPWWTKLA